MPDTITTVYEFTLPEIGGSDGTWGAKLNENWTRMEALLSSAFEEGASPDELGELKTEFLPNTAPGTEYTGTITVKNNNPQVRFEETDQTDPNGRYRFFATGGNFRFQRANAADWASFSDLLFYDRAQDKFTFSPGIKFNSDVDQANFVQPSIKSSTSSDNSVFMTFAMARPWVVVQRGTGVNSDLEFRSTTSGANNFRVMDNVRTNGVQLQPDIRKVSAVGGALDLPDGTIFNNDRSQNWPYFGIRRKDSTSGCSIGLSGTGVPSDGWSIGMRQSSQDNVLAVKWMGGNNLVEVNPDGRTLIRGLQVALLRNDTGSDLTHGETSSGSLKFANANGGVSGSVSGTWMCMGYAPASGTSIERTTLFVKVND